MKSLRIVLLFFSFLSSGLLLGQEDEISFEVKVVDFYTFEKMEGAYLKVMLGDTKEIMQLKSDSTGRIRFYLKCGNQYKVVVGRENKVERYFLVDLRKAELDWWCWNYREMSDQFV